MVGCGVAQFEAVEVKNDIIVSSDHDGLGHIGEQLDGIAGSRCVDRRLYGLILGSGIYLCDISAGLDAVSAAGRLCRDITVSTVLFGNRLAEGTAGNVEISRVFYALGLSGSASEDRDPISIVGTGTDTSVDGTALDFKGAVAHLAVLVC